MKPATLRSCLPNPVIKRRLCISRGYAVQTPGTPTLQVFDRRAKYLQKERAAADVERSRQVDYLKDEVAMRLSERLLVSFHVSIGLRLLTPSGYKSTFQSCPRPRRKLMQHSTSSYIARSLPKPHEGGLSSSLFPNITSNSRRFLPCYVIP